MFESKYSKVLTVILVIVIIAVIGLLGFLAYDYYQNYMVTKDTSDFVDNFQGDVTDGEDLELVRCYIALKDKENAEKYLEFAKEGIENVPEEHIDEFENTLKELEDLIAKI